MADLLERLPCNGRSRSTVHAATLQPPESICGVFRHVEWHLTHDMADVSCSGASDGPESLLCRQARMDKPVTPLGKEVHCRQSDPVVPTLCSWKATQQSGAGPGRNPFCTSPVRDSLVVG